MKHASSTSLFIILTRLRTESGSRSSESIESKQSPAWSCIVSSFEQLFNPNVFFANELWKKNREKMWRQYRSYAIRRMHTANGKTRSANDVLVVSFSRSRRLGIYTADGRIAVIVNSRWRKSRLADSSVDRPLISPFRPLWCLLCTSILSNRTQ